MGQRFRGLRITLVVLLAAGACATPSPPPHPLPPEPTVQASLLRMPPEQQQVIYGAIETAFRVDLIERGAYVRPLPRAARQIDPTWTHDGRQWTVEQYMQANRVSGLLVLKDGKILLERYGLGRTPDQRWTSYSVAKTVTATLVGAAIKDGKIKSINDPVTLYIPELKGSGYDGVTVRQLLMMASGVKWNESYTDPNSDVSRSGSAPREPGVPAIVSYMRRLTREAESGTRFNYSTGETDLVGVLVENAVGKSLAEYASEKIFTPYGMERDGIWLRGGERRNRGGCCLSMTLRDYGRFGQFLLEGGRARGKAIVPDWWTAQATTRQIDNGAGRPGYGYFLWMRDGGAYEAIGIFGQSITTFPQDRIIVVSNAAWPEAVNPARSAAEDAFADAARAAAKGRGTTRAIRAM